MIRYVLNYLILIVISAASVPACDLYDRESQTTSDNSEQSSSGFSDRFATNNKDESIVSSLAKATITERERMIAKLTDTKQTSSIVMEAIFPYILDENWKVSREAKSYFAKLIKNHDPQDFLLNKYKNGSTEEKVAVITLYTEISQKPEPIVSLIKKALSQDDEKVIVAGLNSYRRHHEKLDLTIEQLSRYLKSENRYVRGAAARALGIKTGYFLEKLNSPDLDTRQESLQILTKINYSLRIAIDPLIVASQDAEPSIRALAIESLGKHHTPRTLDVFVNALTDQYEIVRKAAIQSLSNVKSASQILTQRLANNLDHSDPLMQAGVAEIISKLHMTEIKPLIPKLLENLSIENPSVQEQTLRALGRHGIFDKLRVSNAVLSILKNNKNPSVILAAVETIKKLSRGRVPVDITPAVTVAYQNSDIKTRLKIVNILNDRLWSVNAGVKARLFAAVFFL